MQVDAAHLDPAAVEQEPAIGIVRNAPNPEDRRDGVGPTLAVHHLGLEPVEIRRLHRPEPRPGDGDPLLELHPLSRPERVRRLHTCHHRISRADHHRTQDSAARCRVVVLQPGACDDLRSGRIRPRCGNRRAPVPDVQRIRDRQPDVTIDPAPGVPARIRLLRVVHPDRDDVGPALELLRHVVRDADVAEGTLPEPSPVEPHLAVHVDPVELEPHRLAAGLVGKPERLAVPADPAGIEAHSAAARRVLTRRALDAPVVRQVDQPPLFRVEPRPLRSGRIAQGEPPPRVQQQLLLGTGRQGSVSPRSREPRSTAKSTPEHEIGEDRCARMTDTITLPSDH